MNPVLTSLKPILKLKKNVWTDEERIKELAPVIAEEELAVPKWDAPVYVEENDLVTIDFIILVNALNFAFTDFEKPHSKYEAAPWNGAFAMTYCIKRAIPKILGAEYLANMNTRKAEEIFQGTNITIPMLPERVLIMQEVGKVLLEKYDGHFYNLVMEANGHAFKNGRGIVEKLAQDFPSFNDVAWRQGRKIRFYKRAQLAVGVLCARLFGTGLFDIGDIDDLTVYADYVLPVSLTAMGIMKKTPELEDKIQNWREIEAGGDEELEIRAHTIYGADFLIKEVNKHRPAGRKINALNMDYRLWSVTKELAKAAGGYKHHLVRTIYY